jgi:rare lipoprotein A
MRSRKRPALLNLAVAGVCCLSVATSCTRIRIPTPAGEEMTGLASWYGDEFQGKPTSSREIYDMHDLTAAHRTLPFETKVMVTNLNNGRSVIVRINDRGPFVEGRIIDLSYAAASLLGMIGTGIVPVRLEILADRGAPVRPVRFSVQVGSFIFEKNARTLAHNLGQRFGRVYISLYRTPSQAYYRVRIPAEDRAAAERLAQKLCDSGYKVLILEEQ